MTVKKLKKKYYNREISWLHFNSRVLQEAADPSVPLIERIRFLGIFSNNLDEFFRVRYAAVKRMVETGKPLSEKNTDIDPRDLLEQITQIVIQKQAYSLEILQDIIKELKKEDIYIVDETNLSPDHSKFVRNYFMDKIQPALVTYMLEAMEQFPILNDDSAYLVIKMLKKTSKKEEVRYALVEIPKVVNRFVELPSVENKRYLIILDDVIRSSLDSIFSIFEYDSISSHMIKITRDAELDLDSDLKKSFIDKISLSVKSRSIGHPVRFVYDKEIDKSTLDYLLEKMNLVNTDSLIPGGRYHNRRDYMKFPDLGRADLMYSKISPLKIPGFSIEGSVLEQIKNKDYLLHTPYQSFSYIVKFLREAALDPYVKAIRISIYRLAEISHVASSLINAAKNGKDVIVEIELQARFDEESNIRYAEQMQQAGVKLIFGVKGLKVHCKACVIDRLEKNKVQYYGFISTGNFNESTAKVYTDYTLFTSNQKICRELVKVFDFFEVNYKIKKYKHLIVSPHYSRSTLNKLIEKEIHNHKLGLPSGIRLKMNSLSDSKLISRLYKASCAGVKIQLIVRGICRLIPGVEGMSENIEVISVVDKFLEHTRKFIFENAGDTKVYISSADFMTRNIDYRVEITCPIYDQDIKKELIEVFDICWNDNVKARIIDENQSNIYKVTSGEKYRSQFVLYDYYKEKLKK